MCVKNTYSGGMEAGYWVLLAGDGHSNFRRDAAVLIVRWNGLLTQKRVQVMDSYDICFYYD